MDEGHPTRAATLTVQELYVATDDLIAKGRADEAVSLTEAFLDKAEESALRQRKLIYAEVLQKAGRRAAAIACLRSVQPILLAPHHLKLATLLLQEGQVSDAVAALPQEAALREDSQNLIPQLLSCLRILTAGGKTVQARAMLQSLAKDLTEADPIPLWLEFGRLNIELGLPLLGPRNIEHLLSADRLTAQQLAMILHLQSSLTGTKGPDAIAPLIPLIEGHLTRLAWPRDVSLAYAKMLSANRMYQQASIILDRDFDSPETEPFLVHRIVTKFELQDRDAAIALARSALEGDILLPGSRQHIAQLLAKRLVEAGNLEEALATLEAAPDAQDNVVLSSDMFILRRKLLPKAEVEQLRSDLAAAEVKRLPPSLKTALSEIAPEKHQSPLRTVGKIRQLWDYQGQDIERWDDWITRYDWGTKAETLLRKWVLFADDTKKQELRDLIAPIDMGPIDEAQAVGKGAIVVSTHMGPLSASFLVFEQLGHPFRYIGAGGNPARRKSFGIELGDVTRTQGVREAVHHLRQGGFLGMTSDQVTAGGFELLELGNFRLRISTLPARLSWKIGVPTVWCQSEWKDDAIHVSFHPLPRATEGEPREAFVARWLDRHAELLKALLQSAPENLTGLNLFTGTNAHKSLMSTLYA